MNVLASASMVALRGMPRFQLVRKLGEGGMGVVHEVFDRERNAHVALKALQHLTTERLLRFKNEFRALQDLRHPNLVGLDELLESEGVWFFTVELVVGDNFRAYVRPGAAWPTLSEPTPSDPAEVSRTQDTIDMPRRRAAARPTGSPPAAPAAPGDGAVRFDEARLRGALPQLVAGLSTLHDAGLVHRDIKPGNVLVTAEGRVVILDFGLVADASPARADLGVVGTIGYMAPEQTTDAPVGPAADWYAVGVMLFETLTGRLPFMGTPDDILEQKQRAEPPSPGVPRQALVTGAITATTMPEASTFDGLPPQSAIVSITSSLLQAGGSLVNRTRARSPAR
jgi:serine/threonine protein kinase